MATIAKSLAGLLLVIALSGCVSVTSNYLPEQEYFSYPALNEVAHAELGDSMVKQGLLLTTDILVVTEPIKISGYGLTPGNYVKHGESKDGAFYVPDFGVQGSGSITKNPFVDPYQAIHIPEANDSICIVTMFNVKVCRKNTSWQVSERPTISQRAFQQHLIYTGRVGDRIKIGYREFSSNMARPAFSANAEYDLSQSNLVGYKGARVEVLEATNEYIKYRVLQNFPVLTD